MAALATTIPELGEALHRAGGPVSFVPTMGALHAGHRALITAAAGSGPVVVSVFVNPLQFGPGEDFAAYPRDLDGDLVAAGEAGADVVFAPARDELFPGGEPLVTIDPGPLGSVLEGASRPGHFRGVATVLSKLFHLVSPVRAVFGEKDFQQLALVRRLVADLGFPIEIVGHETVREPDGLALSSRNARLSPEERRAATVLYRALSAGRVLAEAGNRRPAKVEEVMAALVRDEPLATLDYAVARDAATLLPMERLAGEVRLLIAARVGPVRLIDNLPLPVAEVTP